MANPVGLAKVVHGQVDALGPTGSRALSEGGSIFKGDTITTSKGSASSIQFSDKSVLNIGEGSKVSIDNYVFDGSKGNALIKMAHGTFRTVTGEIVKQNPESFKMQSPLATIGIRGTETAHTISEPGQGSESHLVMVFEGKPVIVQPLGGGAFQVLSQAGVKVEVNQFGAGPVLVMTPQEYKYFEALTAGSLQQQGVPQDVVTPMGNNSGNDSGSPVQSTKAAAEAAQAEAVAKAANEAAAKAAAEAAAKAAEEAAQSGDAEALAAAEAAAKAAAEAAAKAALEAKAAAELAMQANQELFAAMQAQALFDASQQMAQQQTVPDPSTSSNTLAPGSILTLSMFAQGGLLSMEAQAEDAIAKAQAETAAKAAAEAAAQEAADAAAKAATEAAEKAAADAAAKAAADAAAKAAADAAAKAAADAAAKAAADAAAKAAADAAAEAAAKAAAAAAAEAAAKAAAEAAAQAAADAAAKAAAEAAAQAAADAAAKAAAEAAAQAAAGGGGGTSPLILNLAALNFPVYADLSLGYYFNEVSHQSVTFGSAIVNVVGTSHNDTIIGGESANDLQGGNGDDELHGMGGNDTISGGAGVDILTGDAGDDTFTFNAGDVISGERVNGGAGNTTLKLLGNTNFHLEGSVNDMLSGLDPASVHTIELSTGVIAKFNWNSFEALSAGKVTILGTEATAERIELHSFDNGNAFKPGIFTYGQGMNANDIMHFVGDNQPDPDIMDYSGIATNPIFVTGTGDGAGQVSFGSQRHTFSGMEQIKGTEKADVINLTDSWTTAATIYGGGYADNLFGGAGNDKIYGGSGHDLLMGRAGNDTLDGGDGIDTASYAEASQEISVSVNLQTGVANAGAYGNDTLTSIENVIGSAYDDSIVGSMGPNLLDGGEGDDTLTGGLGDDTLIGGAGDDSLDGGDGTHDVADYSADTDQVIIELINGAGTAYASALGTDILSGIEDLIGGCGNDSLTGDGNANRLVGNQGDDTLTGGDDWDILIGGEGDDLLDGGAGVGLDAADYSAATTALCITLVNGGATVAASGLGNDTLINIENLIGGCGNDSFTGDDHANYFVGGQGNDTLIGGCGDDTLDGGVGSDTADYSEALGLGIALDGGGNATVSAGDLGTDTLISIENLIGGAGSDTLTGNQFANIFQGGDGDDFLFGNGGADTLTGGNGSDIFKFASTDGPSTITDFSNIDLDQLKFLAVGDFSALLDGWQFDTSTCTTETATLLFREYTLYYDADGTGTDNEEMAIVTFSNNTTITSDDIEILGP